MFNDVIVLVFAFLYAGVLFAIAWYGDTSLRRRDTDTGRPLIYALSLGVYCTTWTFFGSVGNAAHTGYGFLPVYIGPILMFAFCWPLVLRVVRLSKAQNITSVADFLAARYGKSPYVAAVVAIVAVVGMLPYLSLQLKAVLITTDTLFFATPGGASINGALTSTISEINASGLLVAGLLALFAILFGTRHIDATEHQDGMTLAIAAESLVKLTAFLAVGFYAVFWAFGGPGAFMDAVANDPEVIRVFSQAPQGGAWLTVTLLSFCCILLLPRQFHMTVVENRSDFEVQRASWLFPLYLIAINVFVIPIAAAGLVMFGSSGVDPDLYVLMLPLSQGAEALAVFAFIGGVSAATAMLIVEAVALSIMVCNGLVMPLLLRHRALEWDQRGELGAPLLVIRRIVIVLVVFLGYLVERALAGAAGLAAIGLISFAAIAQLAPAFFLGLVWRGGTARGAIAGILAGFGVWGYTLLLPWVIKAGWLPYDILANGPLGLSFLRPQALFYIEFDPLTHGVFWSLVTNIVVLVAVSIAQRPEPVERLQSQLFIHEPVPAPSVDPSFRLWRSSLTIGDLELAVGRYLGHDRAKALFAAHASDRGLAFRDDMAADPETLRFAEHVLTSAIGAASARLVLSLLLRRRNIGGKAAALQLLDDASEALQYNRDLLQSAIDQVQHGLAVFDQELRLTCWNRRFPELLDIPPEMMRVGVPLKEIVRLLAERGDLGGGAVQELVEDRIHRMTVTHETINERTSKGTRHIEVRTSEMPQGGIVATFADITERVEVSTALARVNLTLERRVEERTAELLALNAALAVAKSKADEASQDKTRFIAAASHDILQPLNAARLYVTNLAERDLEPEAARIATHLDCSLRAVEDIFGAIIEISRIDAGRADPQLVPIAISEIFSNLEVEFRPSAQEVGLDLRFVPSSLWVNSDRRMLRRLLQNLLSNAIKYTEKGRVLVGVRRRGDHAKIIVADSGPGIPPEHRQTIFREFHRLHSDRSAPRGLGLGLSIVERLGGALGATVEIESEVGRGSVFSVTLPVTSPAEIRQIVPARPALGTLEGSLVLCIYNEPAILEGMQTLLRNWGCEVIAAHDLESAVEGFRAADRIPDMIFADYHLDSATGIDAIKALRQLACADLPAAIITADHSPDTEIEVRNAGVSLLRKPIRAATMRSLISRYGPRPRADAAE